MRRAEPARLRPPGAEPAAAPPPFPAQLPPGPLFGPAIALPPPSAGRPASRSPPSAMLSRAPSARMGRTAPAPSLPLPCTSGIGPPKPLGCFCAAPPAGPAVGTCAPSPRRILGLLSYATPLFHFLLFPPSCSRGRPAPPAAGAPPLRRGPAHGAGRAFEPSFAGFYPARIATAHAPSPPLRTILAVHFPAPLPPSTSPVPLLPSAGCRAAERRPRRCGGGAGSAPCCTGTGGAPAA